MFSQCCATSAEHIDNKWVKLFSLSTTRTLLLMTSWFLCPKVTKSELNLVTRLSWQTCVLLPGSERSMRRLHACFCCAAQKAILRSGSLRTTATAALTAVTQTASLRYGPRWRKKGTVYSPWFSFGCLSRV